MRIAFFNVCGPLSSDGSRLISAILKRAGNMVNLVFLARHAEFSYTDEEIAQLEPIIARSDLVMIGALSTYSRRGVQIARLVRERHPGKKVIWGGPHCVAAAKEAIQHGDAVCYGEGDQVVVELVERIEQGLSLEGLPNISYREDGCVITNPPMAPLTDLDSLPLPDFDLEDHYIFEDRLRPATPALMRRNYNDYGFPDPCYYIMTSRGCPNRCTFCNNVRYTKLFGCHTIRSASVDHFLMELETNLKRFDFFSQVWLTDDDFLIRKKTDLEEFAEKYRQRIGKPFAIFTSPNTFREDKFKILVEAGLCLVQMGIQSGSQRILREVYDRNIPLGRAEQAIRTILRYRESSGVRLMLDFIVDNPYETERDILETVRFISRLPRGPEYNFFNLTFFPGTPIRDRAITDGLIDPEDESVYNAPYWRSLRYQKNYAILVLKMQKKVGFLPRFFFRILASWPAYAVSRLIPARFFRILFPHKDFHREGYTFHKDSPADPVSDDAMRRRG